MVGLKSLMSHSMPRGYASDARIAPLVPTLCVETSPMPLRGALVDEIPVALPSHRPPSVLRPAIHPPPPSVLRLTPPSVAHQFVLYIRRASFPHKD